MPQVKKKEKTKIPEVQEQEKKPDFFNSMMKNVGILIGVVILFVMLKKFNGYKQLFGDYFKKIEQEEKKYRKFSEEKKYEFKIPRIYKFLNDIKKNTPEDAIVLFGPDSVLNNPNVKNYFPPSIKSRVYCTYFLYPRKLIYSRDKESNEYFDKITHVAVTNGWGYHLLPYQVSDKVKQKSKHGIYPLKK